ncbi:hypothetical protein [Microbacterium sp. CJ88]|uniref:hypothetical protein n=1 Tax=Microbacterium sp. CJ88 TaxID=3445672 RepID=UPI003F65AE23
MTAAPDSTALIARVRELESENARSVARSSSRRRWRAPVSALVLVLAALLVPVAIVTAWARIQLVDEDAFVATLAPLAADPAVQDMVIDETMTAIDAQVDFSGLTATVFDGIAGLGLPPAATNALGLLQAPAASGLRSLTAGAVAGFVQSDAFADVWATTTRAVHRALTLAATSDGGGLVVRTSDGIGIQLGTIVAQVKQNLLDGGVGAAQLIPTVDRVIVLGDGRTLDSVRTGHAIATVTGWWMPVAALALLGAGILVARRRAVGVTGAGTALAVGSGALVALLAVGGALAGGFAGGLGVSPAGVEAVYGRLVAAMSGTAVVLCLLGAFVAALGILMGSSRLAVAVRGLVRTGNATVRRMLADHGLDTGRFGGWLARRRVVVRIVIVVLAVLWMFFLRPLTAADVAAVVMVAGALAWVLELLQRRDAERPDDLDDDTAPGPELGPDDDTVTGAASGSDRPLA